LKEAGTTIVFISHDLGAVERVCDRVLLMQRGEVVTDGSPAQAISEYQRLSSSSEVPTHNIKLSKEAEITSVNLYRSEADDFSTFHTGEPLTICVNYTAHERVKDAVFEIFIDTQEGELQCHLTTDLSNKRIDLEPGTGSIVSTCEELGVSPGLHHINAAIIYRGQAFGGAIDFQERCVTFRVDPGKITRGKFYMPYQWSLEPGESYYTEAGVEQKAREIVSPKAF